MSEQKEKISFGRRISMLAAEHPDKTAIIFVPIEGDERFVSWAELDKTSNRVARLLAENGVNEKSMVVIGLWNSPEHYFATIGAWKLGALVLPLRANLPDIERDKMLDVAKPTVVVADWDNTQWKVLKKADLTRADTLSDAPLPDKIPHPGKSMGSGGSTGRPKIIVDPSPWARVPEENLIGEVGYRSKQVQLVAGPLYHNSPFSWGHIGLFDDHTLVVLEKFDAERVVDVIERHRVNFGFLAPTMMNRIIKLPDIEKRDFSSIEAFFHTAAPCPAWLKRAWIELIGGEKLYEGFGSTEAVGAIIIRGDEWLEHPGSLGKPSDCELKILDSDFNQVPAGEVGEIFMRPLKRDQPTYYYIGSDPAKTTPDGFVSVGDMGWVDEQGYLYLADRRVDLIITGGANVYPAEVEAVLTEHPEVGDVAVIGVPDDDWGKRVHAIIQPRDPLNPPSVKELDAHCRARLASYKIPKSYEFMDELPRQASGKLRRSDLVTERQSGWTPAMMKAKE